VHSHRSLRNRPSPNLSDYYTSQPDATGRARAENRGHHLASDLTSSDALEVDTSTLGGFSSLATGAGRIFLGTVQEGLQISSDGGSSFSAVPADALPEGASRFVSDLGYANGQLYVIFGNAAGLYSGTGGIAISKNDGGTFTTTVLGQDENQKLGSPCWPVSVGTVSGRIYVGTMGGLLVSNDQGTTFARVGLE
jgi:hypothetical protein